MKWDSEQECFESFSREFSNFYAVQFDPYLVDSAKSPDEDVNGTEDDQVWTYIDEYQFKCSVFVEVTSETPSMALDY